MSTARSLKSIISKNLRYWHVSNFNISNNPTPIASLTVPGLGIECFDRDGNPKVTSLLQLSAISRIYALHRPYNDENHTFLDWEKATTECLTFASSSEFVISKKIYDPDLSKASFDIEVTLGYVGNSSMASQTKLFSPGEKDEPLAYQTNQVVAVSKKTRKPIPFPDWFKDKYKSKGTLSTGLILKPHIKPDDCFVHRLKVAWSDTDGYNHTNFASYVRFAIDGLHSALIEPDKHSALKGMSKDIVKRGLKDVKVCYLNESVEGEYLDTSVWQNEDDEFTVFVSIDKNGSPVCDITLEYYNF